MGKSLGTLESLKWQFELVSQLAQFHLPAITEEMALWEPSSNSWSVRQSADGRWRPDFAEKEPDPIPTVTIAWVTWQMMWYWRGLFAVVDSKPVLGFDEVDWTGDIASARVVLEDCITRWQGVLNGLTDQDLERKVRHLWPEPEPLWKSLAWANSEIMKNISEIGYIRILYGARK